MEKLEEKYINVSEGIKLHTIITGIGESLILLHGFPDFWYGWKNIIHGLKGEFKLIIPDTRGINLSSKPEEIDDYKLNFLINDIKTLAEKLDLGLFSLVGHDWGGVIAWAFAYKYPNLINKLIILNSPHPRLFRKRIKENTKQRRSSGYIFQLLKPGGEQGLLKNDMMGLKASVFGTTRRKDAFSEEDKKKYIEAWSQPNSILCGVNYYRANRKIEEFSGEIDVPTLVIHGMKDNFVRPTVLEGLPEYVKDLTIVKVENSSHWVMHDEPELVITKIKEFIER